MMEETSAPQRPLIGYGVAIAAVGAAWLLRLGLSGFFGTGLTYITFYPAVMLAAIVGGLRPGLGATVMVALSVAYWLLPPQEQFQGKNLADVVGLAVFTSMGVFISMLAERYQQARQRVEAYQKDLLRVVADTTPDRIFVKDRESRFRMVNEATVRVIGKPVDQVLGKTDREIYDDPAVAEALMANDQRVMQSGITEVVEERIPTPAGVRVFLSTKAPHRDADGRVIGLIGVAHDITERKHVEERLAWLASFPQQNPFPIVEVELASGAIPYLNPTARRLFGDLETQGLAHPWLAGLEPFAPQLQAQPDAKVRREVALGDLRYEQSILRVADSQRLRIYGLDITERKRTEEQLQLQLTVLRAAANAIVISGIDGSIQWVNPAFTTLTGYSAAEAIGQNPRLLKSGRHDRRFYKDLWDTVLAGHVWRGVLVNRRKDAQLYTEEMTITPVITGGGAITHFVAVKQDVSARKRAEAALRHTATELARSNQELEQFAYVASHDLQEPLRAVTGYLGLIEQRLGDQLDDKTRQLIDGAVQGAERMHMLITDLLALSRVGTQGKGFTPTDLNTVLDAALGGLSTSVKEAAAQVTHDPLPMLAVDPSQMLQLFQNLIANAIKFRGDSPPEIHVGAQRQAEQWVFSVRDNGIGMEPQYFPRIFVIFQRLHTRTQYPGTGIGLAICKKIVERHGGTIWVESQPGHGSTFYFTIPTPGAST